VTASIVVQLAAVPLAALIASQAPAVQVSRLARSIQPGEIVVLTIAATDPPGAVHVRAFDRDWPTFAVDERTWRVVVGIDLDVAPGDHGVAIRLDSSAGSIRHDETLTVASKTFRTRQLTVDSAFVNPPASAGARIAREAEELAQLWQSSDVSPLWDGPFTAAVPHAANSAFGTRSIFNGEPRSAHGGADFRSPAGTPVRAPAGGRVLLARDLYYTGLTAMIDHGAGLISLFAHLSSIDVVPGAVVKPGEMLGKVGATGRVTGPHLHWTVRVSGARVDPLAVLHVLGRLPGTTRPPGPASSVVR
jgi:murein DD-endopeptidase MepM/ murein hydrolase activator NlpD